MRLLRSMLSGIMRQTQLWCGGCASRHWHQDPECVVCMCFCVGVCVCVCVCHSVCRVYVFVRIWTCIFWILFVCLRATVLHKVESGWEVGVIKTFDRKGTSRWQVQSEVQGWSKLVDALSFAWGLWKRQALGSTAAAQPWFRLKSLMTVAAGGPITKFLLMMMSFICSCRNKLGAEIHISCCFIEVTYDCSEVC